MAAGTGDDAKTLKLDVKRWRINPKLVLPALPGLVAFGVYLAMLPVDITSANYSRDGGDFLAAALTGGVPHPSGYPTYMLLLRLFLGLPSGSDYFKGSLLSAASAALAVLLVSYLIAYRKKFSWSGAAGAMVGGTVLAFAPLFWGQAVVVEVQALLAFFVALALWWVTLLGEEGYSKGKKIGLVGLALCFGLGTGNHLTLLFVTPLVIWAGFKAWQNGLNRNWIAGQVIAFLAGCAVYFYLPGAAYHYPPVNWGNPQTLAGFWWTVSGAPYQGLLLGGTGVQVSERLGILGKMLIDQFTLAGVLAAVVGILGTGSITKLSRWGMGWVFAAFSAFYLIYSSNDAVVYLIGAWVAVAFWIGDGTAVLLGMKTGGVPWGMFASLVIAAVLIGQMPQGWRAVDPRGDTVTAQFLDIVMKQAPVNALVLTMADADSFPLWYGVFGEGQRKDLRVIVLPLTQYEWYQVTLQHTYPDLVYPPAGSSIDAWESLELLNPGRVVCASELVEGNLDRIKMTCDGKEILNLDFSKKGN